MAKQGAQRENKLLHRPKKSLGQNFLSSPGIAKYMTSSAKIKGGDTVLEVGPGKGIITKALLDQGARVIAIEKDRDLALYLQETFEDEIGADRLKIVEADALEINPEDLDLAGRGYTLVGNIPYFITGALIRHFLESKVQPDRAILMVQKEVGERVVARNAKESILSISVKAFGDPKYLKTVKRSLFRPKPRVDSAIISIENISRDRLKGVSEDLFFEILKKGFSHKRKKLAKNLGSNYLDKFSGCKIPQNSRSEELSFSQWLCLSKTLD